MNFQIQSLPIKSEVALFFLVCATIGCFTQILTNSAVASLFIPILIVICQEVGLYGIKSNIVELPCLNAKMSYPIFYIFLLNVVKLKFSRNLALDKEVKNKFQEYFPQK